MHPRSLERAASWAVLLALLFGTGCSKEKDAFLNRTYHRLTSRDNGWFNANEKLKEVVRGMEDTHVDNYDEVLPLFIYGTEEQARGATPDLEKCIDKCSLVIERHSMDIEGKQRNKWIDDAWFVIAKSQFYKGNYYEAERGFTYISRRFKEGDRRLQALEWQARTAIQLEQFAKAQSALDLVKDEKKLPKDFDHASQSAVQADLELKRGKVDDAIIHLERAVSLTKDRRSRVRWAFILAQLYQVKGFEEKAIAQFGRVVRMNPPYEMAFHAQIMQALAFNKGDSKALRQKLNRMLRDDKHIDHFDMIHYALADLDLKERKEEEAMDHLLTSAKVSTTDTKQKAKTFMKLADIHFDDRVYATAQKYYDSTSTLLSEEHVRYEEVTTRARVLGDLVEQLEIIAREDSLQALAQLDEGDLEKKINSIIRDREREEEEKKRLEEEARALGEATVDKPAPPPTPGGGGRGNWYFYDPQQIGRGLAQFRKRWGNRPLEDNWRRKDKSGSALAEGFDEEGEEGEEGKEGGKDDKEAEWKDPAFYMKDLPRDEADVMASDARVCEALYVSGMIYKEQLKDVDNATESFEVLNNRFEECRYTPESYYQLYRIYLEKEQGGWFSLEGIGSKTYADIILERWPNSEFARLIRDPNILQADEQRKKEEEEAYRGIYQQFRQYSYIPVVTACDVVLREQPRNHFRPKYHILKAMALGGLRDMGNYRNALNELKANYPGTDEAKAADEMLAALDKAAGGAAPPRAEGSTAAYTMGNGAHFYVVVVPNKDNDLNAIKAAIADFGRTYLPAETFQITNNFLDAEQQVVLVDRLADKAAALNYHMLFTGNTDVLADLNSKGLASFVITPENYTVLFRTKDLAGYQAFFAEKYLEGQ